MDAKIDMLQQSGLLGKTSSKVGFSPRKSGESDDNVRGLEEVSRMVYFMNDFIPSDPPA
jgi:hypothetical protein